MEVETRVVAATLKVLGLDSIDGEPNDRSMPASLVDSSTDSKKAFLKSLSLNVIDKQQKLLLMLKKKSKLMWASYPMANFRVDFLAARKPLPMMANVGRHMRKPMV